MIYSERLRVFLHAMDRPDEYFDSFRCEAVKDGIPIIRREMESFLQVLLELKKPERILEIGTATGYSAMRMASFTPDNVRITTIEKDALRAAKARSTFMATDADERICLLEGDAADILPAMEDEAYDFIFMDAAKAQYINFLPHVLRVMRKDGVLVSDNVLQDGAVLEHRSALDRRDRTIHARMREYLRVLKRTDGLVTSIVPVGDGAAVTVKKAAADIKEGCSLQPGFSGEPAGCEP